MAHWSEWKHAVMVSANPDGFCQGSMHDGKLVGIIAAITSYVPILMLIKEGAVVKIWKTNNPKALTSVELIFERKKSRPSGRT